jgi:2-haloacid dehalogenase
VAAPGTVVFDIIGTCFSLDKVEHRLRQAGAPAGATQLWFARALRDAFALSLAGGYQPFKAVLEAELSRSWASRGIDAKPDTVAGVFSAMGELDPQPGLADTVATLREAGWKILALTNGSAESTDKLLTRAGVRDAFARLLSCDSVQKTKPHPAVYEMARHEAEGETWMVAAHAWDIAGASRAGLRTAFITQLEGGYLDVYPPPEVVAGTLAEAVEQVMRLAPARR